MTFDENPRFRNLANEVRDAFKLWHGDANAESPLRSLYLFRQLEQSGYNDQRRINNNLLDSALALLKQTHEIDADLLQKRYLDLWPIHRLAHQFNVAESTVYTLQRQAIERLAETIYQMELQASATQKALLLTRLEPATYVNLIGVEEQLTQLQAVVAAPVPPYVVAIEGIGGIGKTSLADALLRRVIQQSVYDEIGWVSARQQRFNLGGTIHSLTEATLTPEILVEKLIRQLLPNFVVPTGSSSEKILHQLQARLKEIPHLVVIDNLETVLDVESLLPTLQTLCNPSKFLLTSRESLRIAPNIYHLAVTELNEANALQLIRQEAELSNLPMLAACTDEELLPIVATVGGNPLALRLVVGQTHLYTLESILADLRAAQGATVQNLYTFIYRRIWDKLDERSRQVLLIMPLVKPGGEALEFIAQIGNLDVGQVRMALNQLILLNLVDARGGLHERRYTIHSLTRTFLQEQVAKWRQSNN